MTKNSKIIFATALVSGLIAGNSAFAAKSTTTVEKTNPEVTKIRCSGHDTCMNPDRTKGAPAKPDGDAKIAPAGQAPAAKSETPAPKTEAQAPAKAINK